MESKKQPKAAPAVDSVDPRELEIVKEIDEKLKFLLSSRANAGEVEDAHREITELRLQLSKEEIRNKTLENRYKMMAEKLIKEHRSLESMLTEQKRSNAQLLEEKLEDKKVIEKLRKDLEEAQDTIPYRKQIYELVKKACVDGDRCTEAESKLGVANQHLWALKDQTEKEVKMLREKVGDLEKALHKAKTDLGRARAEKNAAKKTIEEMEKKAKTTGRQGYSPARRYRPENDRPVRRSGRDMTPDWGSARRPYLYESGFKSDKSDDSDDDVYAPCRRDWANASAFNRTPGYGNMYPREVSPVYPRATGFGAASSSYRPSGSPDPFGYRRPRDERRNDEDRSRPIYRGGRSPNPARWYSPDSTKPQKSSEKDVDVMALMAKAPRAGIPHDGARGDFSTFRSRRRDCFKAANSKTTIQPPHSAMSPTPANTKKSEAPKKQFGRQVQPKAFSGKPKALQAKPKAAQAKKFRTGGFPQGGFQGGFRAPGGGFPIVEEPKVGGASFEKVGGASFPKVGGASGPNYDSEDEEEVYQDAFMLKSGKEYVADSEDDEW